ncbi:VanZ family protein [Streptomyces iconiensis]|uniref:VanZ family protein n=1 Tax=Streptomyces iconiensis TaxID=1384038 RepID=A0ABT6ZR13_9ACTN|nr:VanZ family protein [Streptomyces iconiensis]MDJ1131496.1 VanZ family protein [Streptomyces iconiensis]
MLLRTLAVLAAFAGMVLFAAVLSRLTLEPATAAESLTHTNLRPGDSVRAYLEHSDRGQALRQLGGNIALGVPFGILLPVMFPPVRGALRVTLCVVFVMLAVELVQGTLVTGRAFDIDDVLLNAIGALAGHLLLGRRLGRTVHPKPA